MFLSIIEFSRLQIYIFFVYFTKLYIFYPSKGRDTYIGIFKPLKQKYINDYCYFP